MGDDTNGTVMGWVMLTLHLGGAVLKAASDAQVMFNSRITAYTEVGCRAKRKSNRGSFSHHPRTEKRSGPRAIKDDTVGVVSSSVAVDQDDSVVVVSSSVAGAYRPLHRSWVQSEAEKQPRILLSPPPN